MGSKVRKNRGCPSTASCSPHLFIATKFKKKDGFSSACERELQNGKICCLFSSAPN